MSSATVRDIMDKEDEEKQQHHDDEESDEEDEDYAPSAGEEESDEEEGFDPSVQEVSAADALPPGKKRAAHGPAKKTGVAQTKRKRRGGIALSDDEQADGSGRLQPDGTRQWSAEQSVPLATKKSSVDDLWAEMNASTSPKSCTTSASAAPAVSSTNDSSASGSASSTPASLPGKAGGLDIKAILAKAKASGPVSASSGSSGSQMVTITQKVDFCGEEIIVTKQVRAGSKEHIAYQQQEDLGTSERKPAEAGKSTSKPSLQQAVTASTQLKQQMQSSAALSGLEFKAALPPPKLPTTKPKGLQGLLATLDGKKKMSTMEKSRHDWGNFKEKQDEHTRAEMEKFAKDGYLAKQAFLQRSDARQAEVARSNRRRGMGLKD